MQPWLTRAFVCQFNNYAAILAPWNDTTNLDNRRGPAYTIDGVNVAGEKEFMTQGHTFHVDTTSSGSTHPFEDANAHAEPPVEVAPGQSNAAGRTVGVAPRTVLYSRPRFGMHSV